MSRPRTYHLTGVGLGAVLALVTATTAGSTIGPAAALTRDPPRSASASQGGPGTPTGTPQPPRSPTPAPSRSPRATTSPYGSGASSPLPSAGLAPSAGPVPLGDPAIEAQPSPEEAAAQARAQAQALALRDQVRRRSTTLSAARATLAEIAAVAGGALEQFSRAQQAEQVAQLAADQALDRRTAAEHALAARRAELGRWARQAYVEGGLLASNPTLATVLDGGSTDDVSRTIQILTAVGDRRVRAVQEYAVAARAQAVAAAQADQAASAAAVAATAAQQASAARDAAVAAQRDTVIRLEAELVATADAAAAAQRQASLLAAARAIAGGGNAVTGAVGSCPGGDTRLYPNGGIPLSALCPVWGASGQYLRADSAFAFDRLSVAYAQQFGRPVCVTDSYRPYADQVRIHATSPTLAAVPGTSNHGWGTAVDLCGGVESFGTATHDWLLLHAPGFGWFHPAWAQASGSKPEPWHWEFGG